MADTDLITQFLGVFTGAMTPAQKASAIVGLFCDNGTDAWGRAIPNVGITQHGPHFVGKQPASGPILPKTINRLFNQLFTSFPNISLAPASVANAPPGYPPFLLSSGYAPPTVAYQTNLITGPYHAGWFPPGDTNYSPPLSDTPANPSASATIPACCIFTFNNTPKIVQLAVYMDRYKLWTALQPGASGLVAALGHATKEAFREFEKEHKK
jgi:hypothetical protein